MKEFLERLSEPTPEFWKKIVKFMIAIGVAGASLVASDVPEIIHTIAGYMISVGVVGGVLAKLTSTMR